MDTKHPGPETGKRKSSYITNKNLNRCSETWRQDSIITDQIHLRSSTRPSPRSCNVHAKFMHHAQYGTVDQYSRTPHNPYLSVDGPGYGLWGGMGLKEHGKNRVEKSWKNRKKY